MPNAATDAGAAPRLKVAEVLASMGFDVKPDRSGLIRSPFRDERTPSFHILPPGYGWKDFGDGSGGGVIDLVMRLKACSRAEALRVLAGIRAGERLPGIRASVSSAGSSRPHTSQLKVVGVSPVTLPSLLSYARNRGISDPVLQSYCREVLVRSPRGDSARPFLAFPNGAGGWVLRSGAAGRAGKRCTCSAPTFLGPDGKAVTEPRSGAVALFEGFFDFLSFLQLRSPEDPVPGMDVCVLNSVTNVDKAMGFVLGHTSVNLWLDNDEAGRQAAGKVASEVLSRVHWAQVYDHAYEYGGFKDVNDYLLGYARRRAASQTESQSDSHIIHL